jgi:hypothetical protein
MKGDVSGITGAGRLTFRDTSVPGPGNTERLVDVALPPFRVDASGRYWGFRIGFKL